MKLFRVLLAGLLALSLGFAPAAAQVSRPSPGFKSGFKFLGLPAGGTFNTLSGSDKSANLVVAGGLTLTNSVGGGANAGVRSTFPVSLSIKCHYEITFNSVGAGPGNNTWGIADASWPITGGSAYMSLTNSYGFGGTGAVGVGVTNTGETYTTGETVAVEVDGPAQMIYLKSSAGGNYGPFSFAGSIIGASFYPAAAMPEPSPTSWTFNFGATPYVITPTAGYGNCQ